MSRRLLTAAGVVLAALASGCAPGPPTTAPAASPATTTGSPGTPAAATASASPVALPLGIKDVVLTVGTDATTRGLTWRTTGDARCVRLTSPDAPARVLRAPLSRSAVAPTESFAATTLDALAPGAPYRYAIGDCAATWTPDVAFATPPEGSFDFVFLGDPQLMDDLASWPATLRAATTKAPGAAFLGVAGDMVDARDPVEQLPQWDRVLSPSEVARYPLAPVVGNHDGYGGPNFGEHLTTPQPSDTGATVPRGGDYAFRQGPAVFAVLNTNSLDLEGHRAFLQRTFAAASDARWRIVFFHQAPFSGGGHGGDADVVTLRQRFAPVLSELHVDLVLNGHDHHYARSTLMNGASVVPGSTGPELAAKPGEVLYLTAGSASGSKYYPLAAPEPYIARELQLLEPTYLLVHVADTGLTVGTYATFSGQALDAVTLRKAG